MLGTNESMTEFRGSLFDSANNLIAFSMQVLGLFGMPNTDISQKMHDTFQSGIQQGAGFTGGAQKPPTISPAAVPKPGSIMIRTTPGGVQVYIDDQYKGSTPEDSTKVLIINEIPVGSHSLDLRKPGYASSQEIIPVDEGNWIVLIKELHAAPA